MKFSIRRYKHDWIGALGIIAVFFAIYGSLVISQRNSLKEEALIYELQTLRYAVMIFNYTNSRNPVDLEELLNKGFIGFGEKSKKYIPQNIASKKNLVDPFGNPYVYDKEDGWIKSSTKKYNEW